MIDLIIPVYNDDKNLRYCLASIAMQTIKDIVTVYVIDDCSDCSYDEILNDFSHELNIMHYRLEKNLGSGYARQYGIDKSNSQYICFLDSDDLLYNPKSIEILYNNIKSGADYSVGVSYDERYNIYTCDDNDLHGKMYKRQFLEENNIIFNNTRIHDSFYFNNIVIMANPVQVYSNENVYFYSDNKKSTSSLGRIGYFNQLKYYFYNVRELINYSNINNCKKEIIDEIITSKKEYINQLFIQATENEKEQLTRWIKQYRLENILK